MQRARWAKGSGSDFGHGIQLIFVAVFRMLLVKKILSDGFGAP